MNGQEHKPTELGLKLHFSNIHQLAKEPKAFLTASSISQCSGAGVPSKRWSSGPAPSSQELLSALWDILQTPAQANRRSATCVILGHPSKCSSSSKVVTVGFDIQLRKARLYPKPVLISSVQKNTRYLRRKKRWPLFPTRATYTLQIEAMCLGIRTPALLHTGYVTLGDFLSLSQSFLIGKMRIKKSRLLRVAVRINEIIYIRCYHGDWDTVSAQ